MKLSEKTKQKIAKLIDKDFVTDIFDQRLPKYYRDFKKTKSLKLTPYKHHLGITSAVFVVEYQIKYTSVDGKTRSLDIFVSAHSDGSRKGAYQKTKFLYQQGFDKGQFRVTRPLFFVPEQKAFFYESSPGASFFSFFTEDITANLKPSLSLIAGWIKELHQLDIKEADFKWSTFRIVDMVPRPQKFIEDFYNDSQYLGSLVKKLVAEMDKMERSIHRRLPKALVYGDYHPENVIIRDLQAKEIEMIDFTDIALGDPMMDMGTFIQQFDFMGHNFVSRHKINEYKTFFIESYFGKKFVKIDTDFINRINLYQSWTALRTAVFLFYMKDVENPVDDLLTDSKQYLNLAKHNNKRINLS